MNAVELLLNLNETTKQLVQSGYPDSAGIPNTWLKEYDPERYFPLISKASEIIFDGTRMNRDNKLMQRVWKDAFRFPVQHASLRPGTKPLRIYLERIESLYLFSSVLASIALTARRKKNEIADFVGGLFQEERHNASIDWDTVYGLPYDEGSEEQRFFKKALRISVSTYGKVESLTPLITMVLPSQVDSNKVFNPLHFLDSLFHIVPGDWSFEDVSDRTAYMALVSSWTYSQGLKLKEYSDEDYDSPLPDDWDDID